MVVAVDGSAGSKLGEEELQQMLGGTVEHLRDLDKVGEGGLLAAHSHHLH